ncbi:DNA methyltransferase [Bradyrhizobium japonicum]|uniref:DNA methyltransferase n=1 Tax=Bradyrhizobium japonicum TaxID=375 RepID=UPI001E2E78DE|nr:DNA methyltransferase [Bradyrhizobium japonicum]MCD9816650.1 site-specific DNA-methyltransferase [Bradyrhizobium japonicum]MEB2670311.1 DNA methyltransferase [Bradyrhizobium japonicum]WRI89662.1 DNA methyltransferase [Bradyrhizobium japonicum]
MYESGKRSYLDLPSEQQAALIDGARDASPVRGLTHGYYKYPARFSPIFAKVAIQTFSKPGDVVLDPHVGGGTTLVEAMAAGRQAVGVDISTLAEFVASVKCTVFSEADLDTLQRWAGKLPARIDIHRPSVTFEDYEALGYYKHLDDPSRWRLRKAIDQALASAVKLQKPKMVSFGRCVVLRTAQWALDGRKHQPAIDDFRKALQEYAEEMLCGARELRAAVKENGRNRVTVLRRNAAGLEHDPSVCDIRAPRLVVTSPPYPGVHVLYHRWQVDGGKEAPLPFMIANKLDGAGGSYYTMGDRKYPELATYFANIKATMSSVAALADRKTIFVQMLAFSEAHWQLPKYLEAMKQAGLAEVFLSDLKHEGDGRLWREVPGRRWYSDQRGATPGSKEVVLLHKKADLTPSQLQGRRSARHQTGLPVRASSARA